MRILPGFRRPHALILHRNEADEHRLVRYVRERRHMDALYLLLSQEQQKDKATRSPHDSTAGGDDNGGPGASAAPSSSAAGAELLVRRADRVVDAESFLHYVLQSQPTADLVDYVLNLGGSGDRVGRACSSGGTILHTAVANGCSRSVVETIMYDHNGIDQAKCADDAGRYPLHWACVNPRKAKKQVCHTVVELLLNVYPEAQDIPDKSGHTPLDLAKMHRTSGSLVRLLNGGVDDESSTSSSASFLRRASFSSKRRLSHRQSSLRRSLTPHTLPDDGASDEGTTDNDHDDDNHNRGGPQDYRKLYQVMASKTQDEDDDDDDISSLGCDDG